MGDSAARSNCDLLIGAIELAMMDLVRQEYIDNPSVRTLYVIDFPRMAQVHCVPPLHLQTVETTGFLPAPTREEIANEGSRSVPERDYGLVKRLAKRFPLALGLTEVLARFVFERAWSNDQPKLMLATQLYEAGTIHDAIQSASMTEWRSTLERVDVAEQQLLRIEVETRGKGIEDLVRLVADNAADNLPAIYGEYSQVRQFVRLTDIEPTADEDFFDRPVLFADALSELRPYLAEIRNAGPARKQFERLCEEWEDSIPETSSDEKIKRGARFDAEALATIEHLNERLRRDSKPLQLVFLTDDGKLFDAAVYKARIIKRKRDLSFDSTCSTGAPGLLNRGRYTAHLLRSAPDALIRKVPILDPRALLTGRRFVDFAAGSAEKLPGDDRARAITEWLPMFFSGGERQVMLIAETYLQLQGQKLSDFKSRPLKPEDFSDEQYGALVSSWSSYVRSVGVAHGLSRYSTRAHLRNVIVPLVQNDGRSVTKAIRAHLTQVMGEWLPRLSGVTFQHLLKAGSTTKRRYRSVPPLILPVLAHVQRSLADLLTHTNTTDILDIDRYAWLAKPTAQNLGLATYWDSDPWKLNYIQAIGLAYGFAIEENWSAAHRLATTALSLAQLHRASTGKPDDSLMSGREAAFLASLSARRSFATSPYGVSFRPNDGLEQLGQLKHCLAIEKKLFDEKGWSNRWEAHQLRLESEEIAWRAFSHLVSLMRTSSLTISRREFPHADRLFTSTQSDISSLALAAVALSKTVAKLQPGFKAISEVDRCTGSSYFVALGYAGRQSLLAAIQMNVFSALAIPAAPSEEGETGLVSLLQQLAESQIVSSECELGQGLDFAEFEKRVLRCAIDQAQSLEVTTKKVVLSSIGAITNEDKPTIKPHDLSLAGWRGLVLEKAGY